MSEYRHRERILRGPGNDGLQEDLHMDTGTEVIRGCSCTVLHRGANVLKERRKMREERERGVSWWRQGKRLQVHLRAQWAGRRMQSRSSGPIRVPPQTRVLIARALGAHSGFVYTVHGGPTELPACPDFRRAALLQPVGSQRLSPSRLGASAADAHGFSGSQRPWCLKLVERAPARTSGIPVGRTQTTNVRSRI